VALLPELGRLNRKQIAALVGVAHERLLQRGKPPVVAIVAAMRKLITVLNAMIRRRSGWCPPLQPATAP